VTESADRDYAVRWWEDLINFLPGEPLVKNIDGDHLFDRHCQEVGSIGRHLAAFTKRLREQGQSGTPVRCAASAIEETGAMICAGPPARGTAGELRRLVAALGVHSRLANAASRPTLPPVTDPSHHRVLRNWSLLLTTNAGYRTQLNQDAEIRGQIPNAFWAFDEDLRSIPADADRVRTFLGLPPRLTHSTDIVFGVKTADAGSLSVPTGWDAFDNPRFVQQPTGTGYPPYGYTRDLAVGAFGAREVVTHPVRLAKAFVAMVL
jgi:hypothetical protein